MRTVTDTLSVLFVVLLRASLVLGAVWLGACGAECDDERWDLDLVEVAIEGGCSSAGDLEITILDPCGSPSVLGHPTWDCVSDDGQVVCEHRIQEDLLAVRLTVNPGGAVLEFSDRECVHRYEAR